MIQEINLHQFNVAIENGPFIISLFTHEKDAGSFHRYVSHYQRLLNLDMLTTESIRHGLWQGHHVLGSQFHVPTKPGSSRSGVERGLG